MRTTTKQQVEQTIKLLVILLGEPRTSPEALAKTLKQSPSWLSNMIERFREAGLDIEYDRSNHRYSVGMSEGLAKGFIPRLASRLSTALKAKQTEPTMKFVTTLDQYSKAEFAEMLGVSPQNVQNMIDSRDGQQLPEGWVAFRISEGGRWFIQRLLTDRSGKNYKLPPNVETSAVSYVTGGDKSLKVRGPQKIDFPQCIVFKPGMIVNKAGKKIHKLVQCQNRILAHSVCSHHYYRSRSHPRDGLDWIREAKAHGIDAEDVTRLNRWIQSRLRRQT